MIMTRHCAFVGALIVTFVALSAFTDRVYRDRMATGTVAELHPGEWMLVTNSGMRLPVSLRQTTILEGDGRRLTAGARVTVWYRNIAERRLVASKIRIVAGAPSR
jgi:hypothetical protein